MGTSCPKRSFPVAETRRMSCPAGTVTSSLLRGFHSYALFTGSSVSVHLMWLSSAAMAVLETGHAPSPPLRESGRADVGLLLRRRSFSHSSFSICFVHSRVLPFFSSICSFLITFLSHESLVRSSICSLRQMTGRWWSGDPLTV